MTQAREPDGGDPITDPATARSRAAMLLITAAHLLDDAGTSANGAAQLACLAGADVLSADPPPAETVAPPVPDGSSAASQIRAALTALGELPEAAFADVRIREGARYARLALRRLC